MQARARTQNQQLLWGCVLTGRQPSDLNQFSLYGVRNMQLITCWSCKCQVIKLDALKVNYNSFTTQRLFLYLRQNHERPLVLQLKALNISDIQLFFQRYKIKTEKKLCSCYRCIV